MDTRGQRQIAAGMELGMHLPVTSRLMWIAAVLTPMRVPHLSLICSLQGYDGVMHINLVGSD